MATTTETPTETLVLTETTEQKEKYKRSFKVKLGEEPQYGRYNGESPYQAANKALSEIIRNKVKANQETGSEITFFLIESTKGSGKKTHQYTGRRVKLDTPVSYTVKNGDRTQTITKEYKNILRKMKKTVAEVVNTETAN